MTALTPGTPDVGPPSDPVRSDPVRSEAAPSDVSGGPATPGPATPGPATPGPTAAGLAAEPSAPATAGPEAEPSALDGPRRTAAAGVAAARAGWARLPVPVRATLPVWTASRLAVALLSMAVARLATDATPADVPGFTTLWDRWDVGLFTKVAHWGYVSPAYPDHTEVDFPAFPIAIHLTHLLVRDWILAGLLVVFIAGAVSVAALWRLAADDVGPERARFAVLALIFFPYAVFLFAGYSEALFLAFATTAWLAATRNRWWLAGLLGAAAAGTRITGIPLWFGLAAQYVVARRAAGLPVLARPALALALPPLPVLAFLGYLHERTGHWNAYTVAMREGWHRWVSWPWVGWKATWSSAFADDGSSAFTWFWRGEVLAVVVGVVVTVVLLRARRYGEAAFLGVATLVMSSSNYYASGIRTILVAFPLYLLLARAAAREPRVAPVYLWLCGPVAAAFVIAFTQGHWVD